MTPASVHVQIAPTDLPSMPPWMGEVAALAQVLTHMGILTRIQEQVRFARARFGTYQRARLKVVRSQTVRLESWDLHRIVW